MAGFKWAESPYPTEKGIFSADVGDRTYVIEHVEPRVWSAHWYYKSKKRGGGALGVFKSRAGAEGACSNEIVRRGRTNPQRRMPHLVGHPDYGIVAVGSHHIYKGVEVEVLGDELDSRSVVVAPAGRGRPAVRVKVDELRPVRKNPGAYTIKINGKVVANYASGVTAIREFGRLLPQNRTKTVALYRHDELLNSVAPVEKRKRKNPGVWRILPEGRVGSSLKANGWTVYVERDPSWPVWYVTFTRPGSKKEEYAGQYSSLAEAKSRGELIPQGG